MARGADVSRPVEIVGGDRRCGYARCRASRGSFAGRGYCRRLVGGLSVFSWGVCWCGGAHAGWMAVRVCRGSRGHDERD